MIQGIKFIAFGGIASAAIITPLVTLQAQSTPKALVGWLITCVGMLCYVKYREI